MNFYPNKSERRGIDSISVTAYRIISIFNMLVEAPCSEEEINDHLQHDIIGARSLSDDTIAIYINTLRALNCTISRPCKSNDYKYSLKSHPFRMSFDDDEIYALIEIKKYISTLNDWKLMINVEKLYTTIIDNLEDEQKKKFIQTMKACLRDIEIGYQSQLMKLIEKYCNKKRILLLNYDSPESGEKIIEIQADKINYENGAFYLWGYNTEAGEVQYIRIDRIKDIKAVNIRKKEHTAKEYKAIYKLTGTQALIFTPVEGEEIIETKENEILIEARIQSKFKFIQRILSYGNSCTVVSPESLKKEIIAKLKSMYNSYKQPDIVL